MVRIEIETENAAFEDEGMGPEVARILRALADKIEQQGIDDPIKLRDINGNTVGLCSTQP